MYLGGKSSYLVRRQMYIPTVFHETNAGKTSCRCFDADIYFCYLFFNLIRVVVVDHRLLYMYIFYMYVNVFPVKFSVELTGGKIYQAMYEDFLLKLRFDPFNLKPLIGSHSRFLCSVYLFLFILSLVKLYKKQIIKKNTPTILIIDISLDLKINTQFLL